jgi:hypothetical protein
MKAVKISDQTHSELTRIVGQLTAASGKVKTYEDAVEALLHKSVVMPPEVFYEVEDFIEKNKQFGYSTKEEFLRGAARWLINHLSRVHKIPPLPQTDLKDGSADAIAISSSASIVGGE